MGISLETASPGEEKEDLVTDMIEEETLDPPEEEDLQEDQETETNPDPIEVIEEGITAEETIEIVSMTTAHTEETTGGMTAETIEETIQDEMIEGMNEEMEGGMIEEDKVDRTLLMGVGESILIMVVAREIEVETITLIKTMMVVIEDL